MINGKKWHIIVMAIQKKQKKIEVVVDQYQQDKIIVGSSVQLISTRQKGTVESINGKQLTVIFDNLDNSNNDKKFELNQAIMASGKTAVLTPYLALHYIFENKKFVIITLSTLIKTTIEKLLETSNLLFIYCFSPTNNYF
jgi:hypothetical protein